MMNMAGDTHGNNISKKCTIIVSVRQSQGNGYMILILFFQIMVLDYIWHHVQSRKRKYICHSVIENTTRMKNWRRNVFMCMKEYGVMRRVGKIQIIHSIGQRVNFAKGVDNICMEDWKTKLDAFLRFNDADVLQDKGKVTAAIAKEFAESEFERYRVIQDSLYESDFDKLMNDMEKNGITY
jgi:hypothetical protein